MSFKAEEIMEIIWEQLPKVPDEDHITLTKDDIHEIWWNGFVDTDAYSTNDWLKAFEPHKTPDETYVLKKDDFLEKDKYRYTGEIMIPFEPLLINEGKYTDEGLQELIDMSVEPSCCKTKKEVHEFFIAFKNKYRGGDNLITMDMTGKREIAKLVYENPSALRRRELLFDAMFTVQMAEIAAGTSPLLKATPEQAAAVQISTFTTLPSSKSEEAAGVLKSIEKSKGTKATGTGDEGVEIKKVKRSRKGFRG